MGVKDSNYQIVYCGETLTRMDGFLSTIERVWGGYWMGQTYADCFVFGIEHPLSLNKGLRHPMAVDLVASQPDFEDDFVLT